jgi:methionine synthase II (cobalamin-independent)
MTSKSRSYEPEYLGAVLTGIAPRSAATSKVHRSYRDGNAAESDFKEAVEKDARELVSRQNNFAFSSYGQLDWLDILRPIAKTFKGFASRSSSGEDAVGPVTRWFRTNTFYRKPLVNVKIACKGNELSESVPKSDGKGVIFLPAPYSFVRLVENTFYKDEKELAMDYSVAVSRSLQALHKKGYGCAILLDHYVGYEQSRGTFNAPSWFGESVSAIKSDGMRIGIHFPMAEATQAVALANSSNTDFVGIDAVFNSDVSINTEKDLLLGVVDGARVGVEDRETVESTIRGFISKSNFSGRYYIGPNDRLYDVPFEAALKKVDLLSGIKGV